MPFSVVKEFRVTVIDRGASGEDARTVSRHGILDCANLHALDRNEVVGGIVARVEHAIGTLCAHLDGAKADGGQPLDVGGKRNGAGQAHCAQSLVAPQFFGHLHIANGIGEDEPSAWL